jgi:diacylglycerol kinase (ATP)
MSLMPKRLLKAARNSWAGLVHAFRNERAFRQEIGVLLPAIPAAWWLGETSVERTLLIGSWLLVLVVELLNSSIEAAIDRIGPEPHELSGRAKDLGSAAVLCSIALAAAVWLLIAVR